MLIYVICGQWESVNTIAPVTVVQTWKGCPPLQLEYNTLPKERTTCSKGDNSQYIYRQSPLQLALTYLATDRILVWGKAIFTCTDSPNWWRRLAILESYLKLSSLPTACCLHVLDVFSVIKSFGLCVIQGTSELTLKDVVKKGKHWLPESNNVKKWKILILLYFSNFGQKQEVAQEKKCVVSCL